MKKSREKISLKYIKPYLLKYKWHYLLGLLTLVFVDIFQLMIPSITGEITDGLHNGSISKDQLLSKVLTLAIIGLSMGIGRFVWRYFIFGTSRKIEFWLRNQYFEQLEKLSLSFYNTHKTGELMAYATNDINAIRMMIGPGVLMFFDSSVLTAMIIYRMLTTISIEMTLLAILPLPLIAVTTLILGSEMRRRFKEKQEAFSHLSDMVDRKSVV